VASEEPVVVVSEITEEVSEPLNPQESITDPRVDEMSKLIASRIADHHSIAFYLVPLVESEEAWDQSQPMKVGSRYYKDSWRSAAERFIGDRTRFVSLSVPLCDLDELLPVRLHFFMLMSNNLKLKTAETQNQTKSKLDQLRRNVNATLTMLLAGIQTVALIRFLGISQFDENIVDILKEAAKQLGIDYKIPAKKQLPFLIKKAQVKHLAC